MWDQESQQTADLYLYMVLEKIAGSPIYLIEKRIRGNNFILYSDGLINGFIPFKERNVSVLLNVSQQHDPLQNLLPDNKAPLLTRNNVPN